MKIEKLLPRGATLKPTMWRALVDLQRGQVLRLTTAREGRYASILPATIGRRRKIQFGYITDGDDILIYIKGKA